MSVGALALVLVLALVRPAAADLRVVNITPSFPSGPYTALAVDSSNARRVAVGTAAGRVAWSDDAGRTATESNIAVLRDFNAMALRGMGSWPKIMRPRLAHRAIRLFQALGRLGMPQARWATWMSISDPYTDVSAISLPASGRMVVSSSGGVYLSDVARTMWTRTLGGPAPMPRKRDLVALAVAVSPIDAQVVLAGTTKGLYVSRDGGFTFAPHTQPEMAQPVYGLTWDATRPEVVVAIVGGAVMTSQDGGKRFQSAYDGEARDLTFTAAGALISTPGGLHVIEAEGEARLLPGENVVGAVAWEDSSVLVATPSTLFLLDAEGTRIELARTSELDPYVRLAGRGPLAYALTTSALYRIGEDEKRAPTRKRPRLRLTLEEVERLVMKRTIANPQDTRLSGRWYAHLLPRVVVQVTGHVSSEEGIMFDGTFPVRYRRADATTSSSVEWAVVAMWDLKAIFGRSHLSNPNSFLEANLRNSRESISRQVRTHYREAAILTKELERPPADPVLALNWMFRLEELAAYLESMSGKQIVDLGTIDPLSDQGE